MNGYTSKVKWAAMLIALFAFLCAKVPVAAAGVSGDCLGYALGFSLLSFADDGDIDVGVGNAAKVTSPLCFINGEVGAGHNIVLGNNGLYSGDAISFSTITLNNYAKVQGQCVTSGGAVTLKIGASCGGGTDTSGSNGLLDVLDSAAWDGGYFACDVASGTPTLSAPAINIAAGKQFTVTDTVTGGLNFIDVPSMAIGNSATLFLSGTGTAGETLVLRVDGSTSIGYGAKIVLTGGLTPFNVVIATQGGISFWGNSSTVNGTVLNGQPFNSNDRACPIGSGVTVNGAVLCEDDLRMGPNARVNFLPAFAVNVPSTCNNAP